MCSGLYFSYKRCIGVIIGNGNYNDFLCIISVQSIRVNKNSLFTLSSKTVLLWTNVKWHHFVSFAIQTMVLLSKTSSFWIHVKQTWFPFVHGSSFRSPLFIFLQLLQLPSKNRPFLSFRIDQWWTQTFWVRGHNQNCGKCYLFWVLDSNVEFLM